MPTMVVLASTFLDTSLVASQNARSAPLVVAQTSRTPSTFMPAASLQTSEEQHFQTKKSTSPSPSSWISFFLFGDAQKPPVKPLLEDADPTHVGATAVESVPISQEPAKISTKKGPRSAKRVTFTPQKARELRKKLKEMDTFHDFMYHSAIASRLASHDS